MCSFSKCELEFKVVLCRGVDCSAPYQQCRQHTQCVCVSSVMPLHAVCASSLKTFMARRAERGQNGPERTTLAHTDPQFPNASHFYTLSCLTPCTPLQTPQSVCFFLSAFSTVIHTQPRLQVRWSARVTVSRHKSLPALCQEAAVVHQMYHWRAL